MAPNDKVFKTPANKTSSSSWGDVIAILLIVGLLYSGAQLAKNAPKVIAGPIISLEPSLLPYYTLLSVGRMTAAYILSFLFTMFYGRAAANNPLVERLLMPLLDVLQSVPILSFLPVVLLGLSAILHEDIAVEIASIVLIFTSQVWNMAFGWYQSLSTIPKELHEATAMFNVGRWMKFITLELPFGMISLIWNSMMSWAGGWFFLMAAETFTVGSRDFRLPGLGAYLQEAANQDDLSAVFFGIGALIITVVLLDQLIWRPLLAWSEKFKIDMVEIDHPATSWFYDAMRHSRIANWVLSRAIRSVDTMFDKKVFRKVTERFRRPAAKKRFRFFSYLIVGVFALGMACLLFRAGQMLISLNGRSWLDLVVAMGATSLRVILALIIALLWTVPFGVAIGTNPRLAAILQPVVQVTASIPATALFPVILMVMIDLPGGLNLAAVLLMLMGTQWYLFFNIIAGASAIPQDLMHTTELLQLSRWQRWRTLILPAIFPYLITGAITASGGAWNASIVAEYQLLDGKVHSIVGIGAFIAQATAQGDYVLLLAATLLMVLTVILINRLIWRRLYSLAEEKYRMGVY